MMLDLVRRAASGGFFQPAAGLSISDLDRVMDSQYGGSPSHSGKAISETTALSISTFWRCVHAISFDMATLPQYTYERAGSGPDAELAPNHYLWRLLLLQTNPELPAFTFYQLMQAWALLWGNAYAEIELDFGRPDGRGRVTALWPWRPDRVKVSRAWVGGPLQYQYRMPSGRLSKPVPRDRMFHLRGLTLDGIFGMKPVDVHRDTLGLNGAMTEHAGRYFGNGAYPGGILYTDKQVGETSYQRLKADWADTHEGLNNAHRIAILEQGLKWQATGGDMQVAQFVDTFKLTQYQVADIFGMPAHRAGLLDRATNSNIEQQALEYVIYTLAPWAANWQNQVHCDLLSDRENRRIYTAFDFTNLLRGDLKSLSQFISVTRQWGILNADEIRRKYLDMNKQPNGTGQRYWEPVNMMPADGDGPSETDKQKAGLMRVVPPEQGEK